MELRVLGSIEAVSDGGPQSVGGPTARRLTAVLLAHRGEVVSLDRLVEAVWGPAPPATAHTTLQTHLSKLRNVIGADGDVFVEYRPPGYALAADADAVDAGRFEAELAEGRRLLTSDPGRSLRLIDAGLGRWRGSAFAEFAEEPLIRPAAVRLEELRLVALEVRVDARLASDDPAAVIGELDALVSDHPLRERFWAQLMISLHRTGRQGEALRAAQALRTRLRDELGLEPSPDLCALEAAIATDAPGLKACDDEPVGVAAGHRPITAGATGGLPQASTVLVGRSHDLDALAALLSSARLVTLAGPGGVGKSSLAEEFARRAAGRFGDGVVFVGLASVSDADGVVAGVAQALGVQRRPKRSLEQSIVDVLGSRDLLLVIDNCEHVIAAVGQLASMLVRWCPAVRLVATSRERLGIAGETVWQVAPLTLPAEHTGDLDSALAASAVELFLARATDASPGFKLDEDNTRAVVELCVALDGMPLALELAAARMASMSPAMLVSRLHERWSLLAGGPGREPRHRTLLDLVQWSYELLDDDEQRLFTSLSVFAGGFDLDAVEATCAVDDTPVIEIAPLLSALVDKSLVVADHADGGVRYRQLETIRQYGTARLGDRPERDSVRWAHVRTFVALAERAGAGLDGNEEASWGDQLDREFHNLRVAVRTATAEGDADPALRIVVAARELGFRRIRYELVDWAATAVELPSATDHELLSTAQAIIGYGYFVRGELEAAVTAADEAIATADRLGTTPTALPERVLGNAHFYLGRHDLALTWLDRMVDAARTSGSDGRLAHAFYMYSVARTSLGDPDSGTQLADDSAAAASRTGSPTAEAQAAYAHGLALGSRDVDAALVQFSRAARLADSVGNHWMRAFILTEAMWLRALRGDTDIALRGYRSVVDTWYRGGDWANQWLSLRQLAGVFGRIGRDHEAAMLFGAVDAAGATDAMPFAPTDADTFQQLSSVVDRRLGERASAVRNRGASMRDDGVVALALETIDDLL